MYLSQQCLTKSMSVHLRNKAADKDLRSHTDQGRYERTQSGKKEKDRTSRAISLIFFFFFFLPKRIVMKTQCFYRHLESKEAQK